MLDTIKKVLEDKREYREQKARAEALPEDYRIVFEKIQGYLWSFATGDGSDMLKLQENLIELFEASAAEGTYVLDVTGEDVVAFCDELLRDERGWIAKEREKLNRDVITKLTK